MEQCCKVIFKQNNGLIQWEDRHDCQIYKNIVFDWYKIGMDNKIDLCKFASHACFSPANLLRFAQTHTKLAQNSHHRN